MKKLAFVILLILNYQLINAQDMYLEYKMTGVQPGMESINKMYLSSTSGLRMDMEMSMPKVGKMTTVTIVPKGKTSSISYNTMSKTYFETNTTAKEMKDADMKFELVGKEKIGPYNCTHIKMIMGKKVVSDMWTTKDISGYEVMEALTKSTSNFVSNKIYQQFKTAGADGLTVKMVMHLDDKEMVTKLIKAEKRNNPASMYKVPAGYTKMDMSKMPKGIPKQ
jgi:Domain of unknown function (DUF4412)